MVEMEGKMRQDSPQVSNRQGGRGGQMATMRSSHIVLIAVSLFSLRRRKEAMITEQCWMDKNRLRAPIPHQCAMSLLALVGQTASENAYRL